LGQDALLLRNGRLLSCVPGDDGPDGEVRDIIIRAGVIEKVGRMLECEHAAVLDLDGAWVTPGLIDACTRMGLDVLEAGEGDRDSDEISGPVQPGLKVSDGIDFLDPAFRDAQSGGISTVYVGPGETNVLGGQGAILKTWAEAPAGMLVRDPADLKAVIGDPPRRAYRERKIAPVTRMGEVGLIRACFESVRSGSSSLDRSGTGVVGRVLSGALPLRVHAKAARDIGVALRLSREFGIDLIIEHANGACGLDLERQDVKIQDVKIVFGPLMAAAYDRDSLDGGPGCAASLLKRGVPLALTTDHPTIPVQDLRVLAGLLVGEGVSSQEAIRTVTLYPARVLGIDHAVGTIEPGKQADIAVFTKHPLDITARVKMLFIGGREVLAREAREREGRGLESI